MYLIKELPIEERPRERLKKYGSSSLSNSELLSILLRNGTKNKSVTMLSQELLNTYKINEFSTLNIHNLQNIKGMGEVKAMTIVCALEFAKRVLSKENTIIHIMNSNDAYYLIKDELSNLLQEKFLVIYLDVKNNYIYKKILFIGTVNSSKVSLRDIFREAVRVNAVNIIVAHNHPAGSIEPSYEDEYLTINIIKTAKLLDIKLLDHLIIGHNDYYSFYKNKENLFKEI